MRRRKLALMLCVGICVSAFTGCDLGVKGVSNDEEAKKKVESAFNNLKNLDKTYEISNVMQAPAGDLCYVEICSDGASYTEYSVDSDGNFGTVAFQNSSSTNYALTDWVTKDGKGYVMLDEDVWASYPDSYVNKLKNRNLMYFDTVIDSMSNLKFKDTVEVDIGMGDESIDLYTATLDSKVVRSILGLGSEEVYKAIKSTTKDENIKKLCDYYLEDVNFTMVFSDANLLIGVSNGVLRYLQFEVGGLGSRLYFTKAILTEEIEVRDEPDFSKAETYESTMKELADYVAKYDSYEEAMDALEENEGTDTDSDKSEDAEAVE